MLKQEDIDKNLEEFFSWTYSITEWRTIPDIWDVAFWKYWREIDVCMLFIDIRESTKIIDNVRRTTAARMYKSFLWWVAKIAKENSGELRSFNGDWVLIVFMGESKRTNACKAALQMNWFWKNKLKPKLDAIFTKNGWLVEEGIEFDFWIWIDVGKVLVVRWGIRWENNNDLVWVGNATNYAVKLSHLWRNDKHIWISADVYKNMAESSKLWWSDPKKDMWEKHTWNAVDDISIYASDWIWSLPV